MFDWLDKKPDHPMFSVAEAKRLLADLPKDKPDQALEEITNWLGSVKDTPGFRLDVRIGVIKLLDETAQPHERKVLAQYLAEPHLREIHGKQFWQAVCGFWTRLAEAHGACIAEYQRAAKSTTAVKDDLPVITSRAIRALACRMKLLLMRYEPVEETIWAGLYRLYSFAEVAGFADSRIHVYPTEAVHTTAQIEFLKAMMLDTAYTENLPPEQIELAFRTASRYAISFVFGAQPAPGCNFVADLSRPAAPRHVAPDDKPAATLRHFGAGPALPKLEEMVKQNEQGLLTAEQRFGEEFSSGQKLTVLRHLILYWGSSPPLRHKTRVKLTGELAIVHGYRAVCKYVTHIEASGMGEVTESLDVKLKQKKGLGITEEEIEEPPEIWMEEDASDWGVGAVVPQNSGKWVAVGCLCAIKPPAGPAWWVGVVRRLHSDAHNKISAGVEVIAKKPVALWLRVLGQGDASVANWETTSGSFAYEYLQAIVLSDHAKAGERPVLLLEKNCFIPGHLYEMMMGDKSRFVRLAEFLEQGENYDMGSFEWHAGKKA